MTLIVPTQAIPNQSLAVTLTQQLTQINLRQRNTGLFMDVLVNDVAIISSVIAENLKLIIRDSYLGYQGDFSFYDTNGNGTDLVTYTGLGSRWILLYYSPSELATLGLS